MQLLRSLSVTKQPMQCLILHVRQAHKGADSLGLHLATSVRNVCYSYLGRTQLTEQQQLGSCWWVELCKAASSLCFVVLALFRVILILIEDSGLDRLGKNNETT